MADYTPNATLTFREDINPELAIIRVKPDQPLPAFEPGQYAELALEALGPAPQEGKPGKIERRSYSIASAPQVGETTEELEFYIVRVEGGYFTPGLWNIPVGGRLWCGPKIKGKFTLEEVPASKDLVMVATGTGLAPFVSMLRAHRESPPWRSVVLVHGARYLQDLGYREYFEALEKEVPWFHYLPALTREPQDSKWTGLRGRVQTLFTAQSPNAYSVVEAALNKPLNPEDVHILLCGNPQMITDIEVLLAEKGLRPHKKKDPGNVHVERYW